MAAIPEQIRFCKSADGAQIAYGQSGSGAPLVWIPHWAHHLRLDQESIVWKPWLAAFASRFSVLRYDFRGCGLSDRKPKEFSYKRYVEDFEAVVRAGAPERFSIFAMSGAGGAIAIDFASRFPSRVKRLVLFAPHRRGRVAGQITPEQASEAQARLKLIELGWYNRNPAYARFFTSLHIPDATQEQDRDYNDLLRATTTPDNAAAIISSFWRVDVARALTRVRSRTLVLHARGDLVIPFEEGRAVAVAIANSEFVPLESGNHVLLASEPAWSDFAAAIEGFLCEHPANAARPIEGLTARERQILELLAQGLDNQRIAKQLDLAEKTVRNQVSMILSKLSASNRAEAIVRARKAGYGYEFEETVGSEDER
jgi:pimeloyl-ACP methyl ester carboxylesterase/DNA-binding CsgD family transcriptional regulator